MPVYKDERNGTWYSKFRYKDWMGNTKDKTKRGFKTQRDAKKWESDFKLRLAGNLEMSFSEFIEIYTEERFPRLKNSTCATKENIIQTHIIPYFGNKRINDITSTDIIRWQNQLLNLINSKTGKPYSRSYLKTVHNQLNAILNHACKFYKLNQNPASIVGNMGNENDIEMLFWTLDEYRRFSNEMMSEPIAYYAFQILYWLGIREGEMLALTKSDFNFDKKTLSISKTYQIVKGKEMITSPKTVKSNRTIIIPDFLCEEIKEYFEMIPYVNDDERIFSTLSKSYLYRHIKNGAKKAGIKPIRVHDLRHSHVSLLINMGYSAVAIASRMGHESIHITYRYAHLFPSVQKDMANELNNLMEDK